MIDLFPGFRELPNVHPVLVHFPPALLILAALLDLLCLVPRIPWSMRRSLLRSALALAILGGIAAGCAFWSGRLAVSTVRLSGAAEGALSGHEDWALRTLWIAAAAAAFKLLGIATRWADRSGSARMIAAVLGLGTAFAVSMTADRGGRLVFVHGAGVRTASAVPEVRPVPVSGAERAAGAGDPSPPFPSLSTAAGDGVEGFRGLFRLLGAAPDDLDVTLGPRPGRSAEILLRRSSPQPLFLLLDREVRDIVVEAELDLSGFQGMVGLVRRAGEQSCDRLALHPGRITLDRDRPEGTTLLDSRDVQARDGYRIFRMVVAGSHLRGYVDGGLTVHGHAASLGPGRPGLMLAGTGTLGLRRFGLEEAEGGH